MRKMCAGLESLHRHIGENYEVIEEGMNGRTTAFTDKIEPGTAALDYLYPCLISQFPLDYIIVMLGTNDTKDTLWSEYSRDWIWIG